MIARSIPEPPDEGYRIRVRQLAAGLARRHDLSLVAYADGSSQESIEVLRDEGIDALAVPSLHHQTTLRRVRRLASGRPWLTRPADDPGLRSAVSRIATERQFDLVQLEGSEFADLPLPPAVPVLVDEHNIWSELAARRRIVRAASPRSQLDAIESAQLTRLEERVWSQAAGVAFCSQRELDIARARLPGGRFAVIPNGVDTSWFVPPLDLSAEVPGRMVFVGLLRYTPNADAVYWFLDDVLPRIQVEVPDATVSIVGKSPPPRMLGLQNEFVRVLGTVPDVRPAMREAAVVVVPLRVGSGTRIKILQALAMGKAVVTTSIGCEGLETRDGEHLIVADGAEAFSAATVRLLKDPDLRARLGAAGPAYIAEGHGWDHAAARLETFHDEILGSTTDAAWSTGG